MLFALGCVSVDSGHPSQVGMTSLMEAIASDGKFSSAHLGIHVESLKTGQVLYSRNGDNLFVPASNAKLFTTAAALTVLSPTFTYVTELWSDGRIEGYVLKGNLVVVGKADPTLSDSFPGKATGIFEDWAKSLKSLGISSIEGDVIIDNSYLDDNPLAPGWTWDDELFCFAASRDAFSFHNNCVHVKLRPGGREGETALMALEPAVGYPPVINSVTTVRGGAETNLKFERDEALNSIRITGTVRLGGNGADRLIAVRNPALFGGFAFRKILSERGIVISGNIYTTEKSAHNHQPGKQLLASHRSPPLADIITAINKESKNLPAELLFLTMGHENSGKGDSKSAITALQMFLERQVKLGPEQRLFLFDGSGLSRYNLVSPKQVVALLRFMEKAEHFSSFYRSLAVAGVDGTLRKQMLNTSCEGNLRGKTGTLKMIRNLSGYVNAANGDLVAFSFMSNYYAGSVEDIDKLYGRLCSIIASISQTPDR
jgi:serine-type D-Ala-D-Ala carboxypeptidase/endopeptidase (penicillin-binding protein 4)